MDSNGVTYIISIFAIVCATSFLALNSVVPSPKASRRSAEYGLHLEYHLRKKNENGVDQEDDQNTTDVVFVHGLGADPSLTWRHGDVCWITDLLPQDLREGRLQSSVRIFTFNYDSFWVRNADSTRLSGTARDLGKQLRDKLTTQLILIGHSYGGLVIKQALVDIPELNSRVKAIMFLGTPHSGTVFAQYGIYAATLFTPFDSDINIIRVLIANNPDLKDLDDKFRALYKDTKRFYYFERWKTRRYLFGIVPWIRDYVVSESSATVGGDFNMNIALDTDHRGLNKFSKRTKEYLLVVEKLVGIISSKEQVRKEVRNESASLVQKDVQLHQGMSLQQQNYLNSSLPPQILHNEPITLFDARGRVYPFYPDFIGSSERFVQLLADKFEDLGAGKVNRREWILQDHHTRKIINLKRAWSSVFQPGQEIDMSMVFKKRKQPSTSCPGCQSENIGPAEDSITCNSCDLVYRRIEEIHNIDVVDNPFEALDPLQSSTTNQLKNKGPKHIQPRPLPPPCSIKEEDDINAYTRVQISEISFNLEKDGQRRQTGTQVTLTLDQLESAERIASDLAQMLGISEEDCLFMLKKFGPKISALRTLPDIRDRDHDIHPGLDADRSRRGSRDGGPPSSGSLTSEPPVTVLPFPRGVFRKRGQDERGEWGKRSDWARGIYRPKRAA